MAAAACFAANAQLGTWKLNEAKSKIAPGMGKNTTVVYTKTLWTGTITVAKDGKSRTAVVNGTDEKGKKFTSKAVYDKE